MEVRNSEGVAQMSPRRRRLFLPYYVVRLFTGGEPINNYQGRKDVVGIRWCGKDYQLHVNDFELANMIANEIMDEWATPERTMAEFLSPYTILKVHDMAAKRIAKNRTDDGKGKKKRGICMLKDTGGSGFWRMVLPASHMELPGHFIDISAAAVEFDQLLEYDIIAVQRLHEWDAFHLLEKLKKARKRVVYDIDDDLYCLPDHNPSSRIFGKDQQFALRACMRIADVVTTTTELLANRMRAELPECDPDKFVVIPNALDPDDRWMETENTGSPDGNLRIFWQGSKTHDRDWGECIEAIDTMMAEFDNLRLMILGHLPVVIQERANTPLYKGRIEFMGFSDPETYFELIKHVRADAGVAPLTDEQFNAGKSAIKVVENALIGIPTVASDCEPFSSVIDDGETGLLATTKGDWEVSLRSLLTDADRRKKMVGKARELVREEYNIKTVVKEWEAALIGQ